MKINFKFEMNEHQFDSLFIPYPTNYGCGSVKFGALYGQFVRHPDGKPTFEISNGIEYLPYSIEVPKGYKSLASFKKEVKKQIEYLVRNTMFEEYCDATKAKEMNDCLMDIESMMRHAKTNPAYLFYNPCAKEGQYTEWQIEYHKIVEHDEYIEIRNENRDLIHMIDVTGTSVMYSMAQLLKYLADNY